MRPRYITVTAVAGAAILLTAGCSSSGEATSSPAAPTSTGSASAAGASTVMVDVGTAKPVSLKTGKLKVGLFMASISNQWQKVAVSGAKEAAAQYGWDITAYDGGYQATTQLNQIQNAVQKGGLDAVILQPVDANLECNLATKKLPAQGIVVVALLPMCGHDNDTGPNAYAPGLLTWVGSNPTSTYNTAWFDAAAKLNPGKQTVALVEGPQIIGQAKALNAILSQWQPAHPDFQVKQIVYTDYTTADALAKTSALLKAHSDVSLIMSVYSPDLTQGVVSALQEAGKAGKIPVVTQGGAKFDYEQMSKGVVQMTIPFFPHNIGFQGVAVIKKAQDGQPVAHFTDDSEKGTAEKPFVITKDNMSDYTPEY